MVRWKGRYIDADALPRDYSSKPRYQMPVVGLNLPTMAIRLKFKITCMMLEAKPCAILTGGIGFLTVKAYPDTLPGTSHFQLLWLKRTGKPSEMVNTLRKTITRDWVWKALSRRDKPAASGYTAKFAKATLCQGILNPNAKLQ